MTTAPVELDTLPDAVRATAKHHNPFRRIGQRKIDGRLRSATGLGVLVFVVTVVVRRLRLELSGTGVDLAELGPDAECETPCANLVLFTPNGRSDLLVGESEDLRLAKNLLLQTFQTSQTFQTLPIRLNLRELAPEPRIVGRLVVIPQRCLQRTDGLQIRLLERAADRHDLADRLHLRAKRRRGPREFLEGKARNLHDHIVERRLEAGERLARDVVLDLVQRVADREERGDFGDREARRLRRERRGT